MSDAAPATPVASSTPVKGLDAIILALRDVAAGQGLRAGLGGAIILRLCARLARLASRFARWAETDPRADPRTARKPRTRATGPAGATLPRAFAWLLRTLPGTATARARLIALLAEPDTIALIEARPATGRALRPLCHLLGIRPPPPLRRPRPPRRRTAARKPPARPVPRPAPRLPPRRAPREISIAECLAGLDLSPWTPPNGNVAFVVSADLRLDSS